MFPLEIIFGMNTKELSFCAIFEIISLQMLIYNKRSACARMIIENFYAQIRL